ncbi:MAG: neutral zinc metallopeptidase, partial [Hyphomicrobium sp.]
MRYDQNDRESSNVEDRRGQDGGGGGFQFPGGNGIQIPIGRGGFSITTLLIIGAVMLFFGINPLDVLLGTNGQIQMPQLPQTERPDRSPSGNIPGLPGSQTKTAGDDDSEKA